MADGTFAVLGGDFAVSGPASRFSGRHFHMKKAWHLFREKIHVAQLLNVVMIADAQEQTTECAMPAGGPTTAVATREATTAAREVTFQLIFRDGRTCLCSGPPEVLARIQSARTPRSDRGGLILAFFLLCGALVFAFTRDWSTDGARPMNGDLQSAKAKPRRQETPRPQPLKREPPRGAIPGSPPVLVSRLRSLGFEDGLAGRGWSASRSQPGLWLAILQFPVGPNECSVLLESNDRRAVQLAELEAEFHVPTYDGSEKVLEYLARAVRGLDPQTDLEQLARALVKTRDSRQSSTVGRWRVSREDYRNGGYGLMLRARSAGATR